MIRTLIFLIGGFAMAAETSTIKLDAMANFKLKNVAAEVVTYKGRKALKVIEANGPGEAMVVLPADFHNGVIEADIAGSVGAGAPEGSRGFVGIAFRVSPDTTKFECFYLRPTGSYSGCMDEGEDCGGRFPGEAVRSRQRTAFLDCPGFEEGRYARGASLWIGSGTVAHFSNLRVTR